MEFGRAVLVLLPFLDRRISNSKSSISDSKSQQLGKLRHGQGEVDPLLAEVFTKGFRVDWVVP